MLCWADVRTQWLALIELLPTAVEEYDERLRKISKGHSFEIGAEESNGVRHFPICHALSNRKALFLITEERSKIFNR